MKKVLKELVLIGITLLPFLYLMRIWPLLPQQVPTHFGLNGEPNDYSSKNTLIWLIGLMGLGFYIVCLALPKIDPKKRLQEMGNTYYTLRLLIAGAISFILIYVLYASYKGGMTNAGILFGGIGGFYAILGNYFQSVRPNYFIGIRTPWTLESESNWKATHRLAGKLWIAGGITIVGASLLLRNGGVLTWVFIGVTLFISFVPIAYSFIYYTRQKKH